MTAEFTFEYEREQETELVEQSLDLIRDADVHISLNALQGVAGGNTLQMTCLIKKQPVPFLMDTGCFLIKPVICRTEFKWLKRSKLILSI